jgi:hypothetical protein
VVIEEQHNNSSNLSPKMSSTLEQKMRATTEAFLYSFDGQWQPDATMKYRAPECIHKMLPATINVPPKNNEEWAARFKNVAPLVTDGKVSSSLQPDVVSAWATVLISIR